MEDSRARRIATVALLGLALALGVSIATAADFRLVVSQPGLKAPTSVEEGAPQAPPGDDPSPPTGPALYSFTSHTFTNCGQTGGLGPSLEFCQAAYQADWAQDAALYSVDGGIQRWVVPESGLYRLEAAGAAAAATTNRRGAVLAGEVFLAAGTELHMAVGQIGSSNMNGGGGTFVVIDGAEPLLVAGGAGGGNSQRAEFNQNFNGRLTTSGARGEASGSLMRRGAGGENALGGGASSSARGGGGLLGGGVSEFIGGGESFMDGARGGAINGVHRGGFGGGGSGSATNHGGGGGGYSGGGGGGVSGANRRGYSSGGGGSFISDLFISAATHGGFFDATGAVHPAYTGEVGVVAPEMNAGHGYVVIERLED
ncbi:hypothetical protein J2T57_001429 [Natronocella acetinitrilica]|uniref:Glycine rich protein n=1 Tax=Natronocella acetinitrilica TaxID=414046 RepID=A0AAE3G2P7_9GAMM|nr:hypothetical protein [Natronocella acetinitrilica]MCP1674327.1 hypothetical protein [Natronocella acetinitrilica]